MTFETKRKVFFIRKLGNEIVFVLFINYNRFIHFAHKLGRTHSHIYLSSEHQERVVRESHQRWSHRI